ncbi:MAG: 16S rRNA (uracil(1498)-N(3))-methyltransferase [Limnospira sp. PMC 1291.21]|uniref:Ribosomal RNA small subunit methyltransferase E n=1 Tax=Limnospira fusiformis PMC 851.14 TaxID=2219512 RepID=A0ABU9EGS9_LIMFS|nr:MULTISPECIES: 16S rRNA (uracil(1498)-N(3))-methyltransferase [Limnospira]MDT9179660.1 16S rRNA (uracil(1498)-N(3))-methyltransferase [Limnospira sp. PMC 1238.20]MDT9191657.1 16S rRNA (uracil(1498)-N(3))-methyltransferase [Limnospira sp. PMC 1245.20]MDT9200735.1 16S rRNA (uracil(1498)-N(3))-methyltransferase [Limnospira sp. PMC 1042.18]MDT9201824.1 16S rRNA (uracil(1498)-N(3))-methyltransferase [Limnospira sp. PMC 1243.20]MDT9210330.1 16S rRNA (uracil(1498)-N(3))-methyltransferase [Limnospir
MRELQRIAIASEQFHHQQVDLTAGQQHYLGRVLRLQPGDRFIILDGRGGWWLAIWKGGQNATVVEPIRINNELPIPVTLWVSMPKGSGFEEIVRCTTELGVSRLVPIISARTVVVPSPQKLARWRRIATEAAEQSERQILPEITDPLSIQQAWETLSDQGEEVDKYICVARGDFPHLLNCLLAARTGQGKGYVYNSLLLAIGPEGGWTTPEVEEAINRRFQPVSLGSRILRSVTAPMVALSLVAAVSEMDNY